MSVLDRRQFLILSALGSVDAISSSTQSVAQDSQKTGDRDDSTTKGAVRSQVTDAHSLRITAIESHEILLPYHDFNAQTLFRYHGLGVQLRTIFIVKTNQGLEGYGETWGRASPDANFAKYIGTSPFDWIGDSSSLSMNMALYDLMGKFLNVPVWKLIGPKRRDRIPVSAWTVSQPPKLMAEEVRHAASLGFRWLKYHTDEVQNVVEQTKAMQAVAPEGFKVHFDFNANATLDVMEPVIRELEKFPIAGRFEDPIVASDVNGWKRLRDLSSVPIVVHHGPLEFLVDRVVDGLMAGHASVGEAAKVASIADSVNLPIMLQQCGGTINQAFLAHEAAVFKMATIDHCSLLKLWKDDITNETFTVTDGHIEVPRGPGLGVTINHEK
ncbi:MAG: hypothetical protein FJ267_12205, partial [Planctomycetes bacterium]|nr:hypothetical protein [Planctomycetota bacterium]